MITTSPTSVTTTSAQSSGSTDNQPSPSELQKDDFLKLLVTQLKNQDPMNPVDNAEFTAQMAQFSSLEQLVNINETLGMLNATTANVNAGQAFGLIGKEVTVEGSNVHVKNGVGSDISFNLADSATEVEIQILDPSGNVVRTITVGAKIGGANSVAWDGLDSQGKPLPDGLYKYSVAAKDAGGNPIDVQTNTTGVVDAVSFENGVAYLHIGDLKFMLSEVKEVRDPTGSTQGDTDTAEDTTDEDDTTDDDTTENPAA